MTKIICDVVLCENNKNFICQSNTVNIRLSHINDSNGKDYTVIIECDKNTRNNK